jgi:Na+/H+-dicarboxylate symporter
VAPDREIDRKEIAGRWSRPGAYFGIPLPAWVLAFLAAGLTAGLFFPDNRAAIALYMVGTYFPRIVVTFATLIVLALLSGATAKLVLVHRRRARRLFGLILMAYVTLGLASLIFAAIWIPILARLPFSVPGAAVLSFGQLLRQIAHTFATLLSDQPLIQALAGAVAVGYFSAAIPRLRSIAHGLIKGSDVTLWLFKKLLWYYPIMIGCLAIGIPLRFGIRGMNAYGQTILWVALVTVSLSVFMVGLVKLTTRRTFRQIFSYLATVWPTGFGTGGSYETLAMNVVSAESDLGLRREIAEVSVVFGTVLNKSCATISILLVTISVTRLLDIPISLSQILMLIPPVLILGLESPGIPGGAGFFMSPIVAALLHVRDVDVFVAMFVTMYSGLIPMLSTAGNTTNDGLVGAILNDRFTDTFTSEEDVLPEGTRGPIAQTREWRAQGPRGWLGWIAFVAGAWMLVAPQSRLGLKQLQWMYNGAFRGEVLLGILVVSVSLYVLSAGDATENSARV